MSTSVDRAFQQSIYLLLFGPVIGAVHFMSVYLFSEAACKAGWLQTQILGMHAISFSVLVATFAAAIVTLVLSRVAHQRRDENGPLASVGLLLGILFTIEILFVGVSAAFLQPC